MNAPQWYPIFWRQMRLFRKKLLRPGYLFSAMVIPAIYLITFGIGLGRGLQVQGKDYLAFLLPGLVAMSSMTNSYSSVATSLNLNRIYFKTFQIFIQAPISAGAILTGEVLAGLIRGLFAASLMIAAGMALTKSLFINPIFIIALLVNCFLFSSFGVVVGMITKSHEDTSTYTNFFITPMAFFCGTFFPIDRIPAAFRWLAYLLPLTHTNILIRKTQIDDGAVVSLLLLLVFAASLFGYGARLIKNYSE